MRKLFLFFVGLLMLASMLGLLFFAGAIYDSQNKNKVETFFFEPNSASNARVAAPVSATDMPNSFLRDSLIARFLNEYFYVIPDTANAEARAEFRNTDGTHTALRTMSYKKNVAYDWRDTIAPDIKTLAANGVLRQVEVVDIADSESGHLVVNYRLKTWDKPNDVLAGPVVTFGVLYLDVTREPVRIAQTKDVLDKLMRGWDPVYAFDFGILDVLQR